MIGVSEAERARWWSSVWISAAFRQTSERRALRCLAGEAGALRRETRELRAERRIAVLTAAREARERERWREVAIAATWVAIWQGASVEARTWVARARARARVARAMVRLRRARAVVTLPPF